MWRIAVARIGQKHRTFDYLRRTPDMPVKFRGRPVINDSAVVDSDKIIRVCPTGAVSAGSKRELRLDMGKCLFCGACEKACSGAGIRFSREHGLAARRREDLVVTAAGRQKVAALDRQTLRLFGRSLKLRQVSAGGCNACESDINVLNTPVFDLGRFGIQFVASPRHADGLLITGPVTRNMELALKKTYAAVPAPKIVIAVGACAISGGIYAGQAEALGGAGNLLAVDLFIPGCPPHPWTIMDGLLRLLGRL